jgi:signal transduction histidine kinase
MNLTDGQRIRFGRGLAGSSVIVAIGGLVMTAAAGRWEIAWEVLAPVNALVGVGFGALAWTVLPRQPRNGSVWAYTWAAFFGALFSACLAVLVLSAPDAVLDSSFDGVLAPADLPWPAAIAIGTMVTIWLPCLFLPLTLGLLLFPDGRLPSPRWRWVGWYQVSTLTVAVVASLALNNRWSTYEVASVTGTFGTAVEIMLVLAQLGAVLGMVSLVPRYRRGDNMVRRQIRWIATGGAFLVIGEVATFAVRGGLDSPAGPTVENTLHLIPLVVLIASFWVAITKFRLYEIDTIISKSVAYLGLAAVIAGLYAAVVIAPLLVIGRADDGGPGLVLPIVAAAVVALLFEPIRSRMQRWANRLVYGDRASPYEVLSRVTSRLSDTTAGDGTDDLARLLAEGTGAERAVVWLRRGDVLHPAGVSAADRVAVIEPVPIDGLVDDEFTESRTVHHRDDQIGALTITKPRNDQITPADRELLTDVAAGAGLLLRNIGLNRELETRADEVRASRRRLLAAQDAERHRLERDLHDGAQQQVVALKVKLGIAKTIAEREGADEIATRVIALAEETQHAVDALRAVAHGIYPPLLESEGLESALRAVERSSSMPLVIETSGLSRYPRPIEETTYFCVLDLVERARMTGASGAHIDVASRNGDLIIDFDVTDGINTDGVNGVDLTAVSDRVDAAGGTLLVAERHDGGRRITTSLPVVDLEVAPT